jgi:DNA-binding winged helix-turn-helix (wHTH) protein
VFDLLVELVHNQHRVVARGELSRFLWSDTVVCNGALDQCVAALRRVLGDSAREERYIRTIRRRGYRFVGGARLLAGS